MMQEVGEGVDPLSTCICFQWAFSEPYSIPAFHYGHHVHQTWREWYIIPTPVILLMYATYK